MIKKAKKQIDLTGLRFGNLTVIEMAYEIKSDVIWLCQCDCGLKIDVDTFSLLNGVITTCDSRQCSFRNAQYKCRIKKSLIRKQRFTVLRSKLRRFNKSPS